MRLRRKEPPFGLEEAFSTQMKPQLRSDSNNFVKLHSRRRPKHHFIRLVRLLRRAEGSSWVLKEQNCRNLSKILPQLPVRLLEILELPRFRALVLASWWLEPRNKALAKPQSVQSRLEPPKGRLPLLRRWVPCRELPNLLTRCSLRLVRLAKPLDSSGELGFERLKVPLSRVDKRAFSSSFRI